MFKIQMRRRETMNKQLEEKSILKYDDRRKELTQVKSQISENKTDTKDKKEELISTIDQSMKVVYTEEGIRLAHKNLSKQKSFMENRIAQLKKQFEDQKEMPEDLKEFKKKLEELSKFAATDKAKAEYENLQIELKSVKKDMDGIINAIGSRLKL